MTFLPLVANANEDEIDFYLNIEHDGKMPLFLVMANQNLRALTEPYQMDGVLEYIILEATNYNR